MDTYLLSTFKLLPLWGLSIILIITLFILARSADKLVDQGVLLAKKFHISQVIVGATIISLGTTLPEAAVSVLAAFKGAPGLALGNAVGSIICDTGLILGICAVISKIPLDKSIVNRQGYIQLGAGVLLIIACFPFSAPKDVFTIGGNLPQFMGIIFLGLLAIYIWFTILWSKKNKSLDEEPISYNTAFILIKLFIASALVIISSNILIYNATEIATRLYIPEGIIAATIVAFGTSLPELVTSVSAVRKNHGGIAIGNIIGADILNVLFVAGSAAAVTKGGLIAGPHFFKILFPSMLAILLVFRFGVILSKKWLNKIFGFILLTIYILVNLLSYS